jgi:hypothetical protein
VQVIELQAWRACSCEAFASLTLVLGISGSVFDVVVSMVRAGRLLALDEGMVAGLRSRLLQ